MRLGRGITSSPELKTILENVLRGMATVSTKGFDGLNPTDDLTVILRDTFQKNGSSIAGIYDTVREVVKAAMERDISRTTVAYAMEINRMKFVTNTPTRLEPVINQHFCRAQVCTILMVGLSQPDA